MPPRLLNRQKKNKVNDLDRGLIQWGWFEMWVQVLQDPRTELPNERVSQMKSCDCKHCAPQSVCATRPSFDLIILTRCVIGCYVLPNVFRRSAAKLLR